MRGCWFRDWTLLWAPRRIFWSVRKPSQRSAQVSVLCVLRCRAAGPRRPPPAVAPGRDLAMADHLTAAITRLRALAPG